MSQPVPEERIPIEVVWTVPCPGGWTAEVELEGEAYYPMGPEGLRVFTNQEAAQRFTDRVDAAGTIDPEHWGQ